MQLNPSPSDSPGTAGTACNADSAHFCDQALTDLRKHDQRAGSKLYNYALQIYLADCGPLMNRIATGVTIADHAQIRRAAHSLKSNSLLVGALQVGECARVIEALAHHEDDVPASLVADLVRLSTLANDEIARRLFNPLSAQ